MDQESISLGSCLETSDDLDSDGVLEEEYSGTMEVLSRGTGSRMVILGFGFFLMGIKWGVGEFP